MIALSTSTGDEYIDAILDDRWHRSVLVRAAKAMRARAEWVDAGRFERGCPWSTPYLAECSGTIEGAK